MRQDLDALISHIVRRHTSHTAQLNRFYLISALSDSLSLGKDSLIDLTLFHASCNGYSPASHLF